MLASRRPTLPLGRSVPISIPISILGLLLVAACGSGRPAPSADGPYAPGATAGPSFGADAGTKPPGCGTTETGAVCECVDVPLFTDAPNLYFVLDRSGSMGQDNKWDQVRVTLGKITRALGPRANFGATMFPGPGPTDCAPGVEVMAIRPGDPPSSGADGPTTTLLLDSTRVPPIGGTPTATTLQAVRTRLGQPKAKTFVILATDGGPNCNSGASCGFDHCIPNIEDVQGCPSAGPYSCCEPPTFAVESCLDANPTLSAVSALKAAGFPVYVLGIPGSAAYATLLNQLATAGGTAQTGATKYYRVDSTSDAELLKALKKIAAQIVATCEFDLKEPPTDPNLVNVYMDDVVQPRDPINGYTIDGSKVTLVGTSCERVKSGDVLSVRVIAGCPTVTPR